MLCSCAEKNVSLIISFVASQANVDFLKNIGEGVAAMLSPLGEWPHLHLPLLNLQTGATLVNKEMLRLRRY